MVNSGLKIGVCSWSLKTDINGVAAAMDQLEVDHVHLGVASAVEGNTKGFIASAKEQSWTISSTMVGFAQENYSTLETIKKTGGVVPDDAWPANMQLFTKACEITKELGVKYISTHAGFIDHTDAAKYAVMLERIKTLADIAAAGGVTLLMETGQETANDLAGFLKELNHSALGVNFDPANMILYDKGNPIEAIKILAPWIKHVHIKDAVRTETPGKWGKEVPWGQGDVDVCSFLAAIKESGFKGTLAVEREAGDNRLEDIAIAVNSIKEQLC